MRIIILPLILSLSAHALVCDTDSDCLSQTLALVKKARKLNACPNEVKAIQSLGAVKLSTDLKGNPLVNKLDDCLDNAKLQAKRAKRAKKLDDKLKAVFGQAAR